MKEWENNMGHYMVHYGLCTTTTIAMIVVRDNVHELSTNRGNFMPKKVTQLFIASAGPNPSYKILFLQNHNCFLIPSLSIH